MIGDVWSSANGIDWTLEASDAEWEEREHYGVVVFKERMFIFGGVTYFAPHTGGTLRAFSDVWSSTNGRDWEPVTRNAPWGPRRGFGYAAKDGYIWLFGGFDSQGRTYNDVWKSPDGRNWQLVTADAGWQPRGTFKHLVYGNEIWIFGGNVASTPTVDAVADVWKTNDGKHWVRVTDKAPWEARAGSAAFVVKREGREWMAISGGFNYFGGPGKQAFYNDLWVSADGINWTKENLRYVK